jgi:dolichol-phosphate mannosyltransferase
MKPSISIVIALYNEEENVRELTKRIYSAMGSARINFELIYVIDGNDNTYPLLKEIQKSKKNMILDYSAKPRGFRKAFVKGFSLADKRSKYIVTMDGDLNHQPEEIKDLIRKMELSNADIVVGSRYLKYGRVEKLALWKRSISIFANFVMKILWGLKVKDKTSGFRLYKKEVIDRIAPLCRSNNFAFLFEILILANSLGYNITEIPIIFKARERGKSKFELWKTIKGYIFLMLKYLFKRKNKKPIVTRYVANKRVKLILNRLKRFDKNKIKILDVGCGDRYITDKIKNKGYNIMGVDRLTKKNCRWITKDPDYVMDARHLKFKDNSFDVVISLEVIEHCDCISEINRVLKPKGIFFCSTPTPFSDWVRRILIFLHLLENQDFEGHDHITDLRKVPMKLLKYRKMFLWTSQFGIFTKRMVK